LIERTLSLIQIPLVLYQHIRSLHQNIADPPEGRELSEPGPRHHRRGAALRCQPQGEAQETTDPGGRPHADGDPHPADPPPVARRHPGPLHHQHPA